MWTSTKKGHESISEQELQNTNYLLLLVTLQEEF